MTFMPVCANNSRIDRDMVGHQGVGDNSFFKPKVFGRMASIDSMNLGFKFLSIATGMNSFSYIVILKYE